MSYCAPGGNARTRPVAILELHPEEKGESERRRRAASTSQHDIERARIVPPSAEGLKQKEAGESLYVDVGILGHGSRTGHVLFTKRSGSIAGAYSSALVFVLTGILPLISPPSLFFVMRPIARVVRD